MLVLLLGCEAPEPFAEAERSAAIAAAGQVSGTALMTHVANLVDGRAAETPYFPPEARYAGMPFTHENSAAYIQTQLLSYGLAPELATGGEADRPVLSVWADIPGTTHPEEIILVSAHHDAWFAGADDNASGVAVILEVARIFAAAPPGRTVRIASFDREEEGLVGSAAYARDNADTDWYRVVNLDSVGYTDSTKGSQQSILGLDAPETGDFLAVIAAEPSQGDLSRVMALGPVLPDPVNLTGVLARGDSHGALLSDLLRSDHAAFWSQGAPGLFLTDTTEFRNPRYHTAEDTIDTLNPEFLAQVGGFTAGIVAAFAEAE